MSRHEERQQYTKDHFRGVLNLWETTSCANIAERLNIKRNSVGYLANQIRRAGYKLPKKRVNGKVMTMVKEVIAEFRGR